MLPLVLLKVLVSLNRNPTVGADVTPLVMILLEVSLKVTATLIHCPTLLAHVIMIIIIIHLPFHVIHHGLGLNLIINLSDFMLA